MKAAFSVVLLLACALQWPRGILAVEECDLRGAAKCFKKLFDVMNDNMPHLAQEEDSALDGQIDILIGHLPAQPDCLGPSEQCATAAEKEYFTRARLNYEKFRQEIVHKSSFKELIRAFKCYDGERFKACVSKIILNFFSVPLKTSKAGIKELTDEAVEATRTCLVPQGTCPESAKPGKEVAEKLLAAFQDAWSKDVNGVPAPGSSLGVMALVLGPLAAHRLL
uniref:Putative conserved secreted protein n=1 Tax=Ixodes scapularis TaxID=6945 RepID=A0A4D5RJI9_IXOSC